jgi:hypothetical protein
MGSDAARRWVSLLVGVAAVAGLSASCCKKKTAIEGEDIASAVASDDPGLEDPGETHRDSKVDRTIKCFNAAMRINKAANHYFKRLGGGLPRAGRVPSVLFAPPPNANQLCQEAKTDLTPPMPEIDKMMPRYVELVASLSRQLEDMDRYYRDKGYKSDGYKRAKQMHGVFKADHEEFQKLHDELAEAIDAVADKRDDESIEKESKVAGLRYFSLVFLRDAKLLSREVTKDKPDAAKVSDLRNRIEASHKGLSDHAAGHPDQVGKAFMFAMYKGRADTFVESVRSADPSKLDDRDLDDMLNKYNAMIDASNLVRWRP